MKTAVLVIDMQEDLFKKERLKKHRKKLVKNINEMIHSCRSKNLPIIWVCTQYADDLSDAPVTFQKKNIRICIKDTPGYSILFELDKKSDEEQIIKKNYSAFFGTKLNDRLKELHVNTIIMAGINTHACIRTAAIDAFQLGYEVIVAKDSVDSYDKVHHDISLKYMQNRIATLMKNKEIESKIL